MREKFTPAIIVKRSAFAMASLVLAATMDVASASTPTGSAGAPARFEPQQSVRLAEAVALTKSKNVKKTNLRRSGKTWLNPQPEPPMGPAKINQGKTWLNPQPDPPRPDTRNKNLN
jgi:hypothetical protein